MLKAKAYNVNLSVVLVIEAKLEAMWANIPAEDVRARGTFLRSDFWL